MRAAVLKIIAASALAAIAFGSAASAADLAARPYTKAPPIEVWNWTGFYVGGNAGYSWGKSHTDVSYYNTGTGLPIVPPPGSITSAGSDMNGGIAGGQAGYNWQSSNWVWGVEADIQWSGEKGHANYLCAATNVGGVCLPALTFLPGGAAGTGLALDRSLEWFGTARLRGGVLVSPRVLLYATGGLAYGEIKTSGTLSGFNGNGGILAVTGSSSDTRFGWTVGAGVEGMLTKNWTAKLEYLYMDLGRYDSATFVLPANVGARVSSDFTDHILRVGINYKFDR